MCHVLRETIGFGKSYKYFNRTLNLWVTDADCFNRIFDSVKSILRKSQLQGITNFVEGTRHKSWVGKYGYKYISYISISKDILSKGVLQNKFPCQVITVTSCGFGDLEKSILTKTLIIAFLALSVSSFCSKHLEISGRQLSGITISWSQVVALADCALGKSGDDKEEVVGVTASPLGAYIKFIIINGHVCIYI